MSKNIYILVGPPGSGKSTWIENEFPDDRYIVSTDNIIEAVARDEGKTYNEVFLTFIKEAEPMMFSDFELYVEGGYDPIIVDRTNMNKKARARFLERIKQFGKKHDYHVHAVVFPKPEDEEYERRLNRPGKTIPREVINGMLASFQMPTIEEGFASVTVIEQ